MRSVLAKAVRKYFDQQVSQRLPSFHRDTKAVVPPGWVPYRSRIHPKITSFFVLCLHNKSDAFTIEGAWSRDGIFPAYGGLQYPRSWPAHQIEEDMPKEGRLSFRLALLWQPHDFWWWLVPKIDIKELTDKLTRAKTSAEILELSEPPSLETAIANVQPMVDDAIQRILDYAIPYFDKVAVTIQ